MAGLPTGHRPTIRELKQCLQNHHGCEVEVVPMFKSQEDGPSLRRMTNPATKQSLPIDRFEDDEDASPSIVDYFCRKLGLDPKDVHITGPTGPVSVHTPKAPSAN